MPTVFSKVLRIPFSQFIDSKIKHSDFAIRTDGEAITLCNFTGKIDYNSIAEFLNIYFPNSKVTPANIEDLHDGWKMDYKSYVISEGNYRLFVPCGCNPFSIHVKAITNSESIEFMEDENVMYV